MQGQYFIKPTGSNNRQLPDLIDNYFYEFDQISSVFLFLNMVLSDHIKGTSQYDDGVPVRTIISLYLHIFV